MDIKLNYIYKIKNSQLNFLMPVIIKKKYDDILFDVEYLIGPKIITSISKNEIINFIGRQKYFKNLTTINLNISNNFIDDYNLWSCNNYGFGNQACLNEFIIKYQLKINKVNKLIIVNYHKNNIYSVIKESCYYQFFCPLWILLKYKI